MRKIQRAVAIILVFPFFLTACAGRSHQVTDSSASSLEFELGEAIHKQILQTMPVCHDVKLNQYVQSIGKALAQAAERDRLVYRFVILEDGRIHATHAPGGYVYITTGFFRFLQNEIELAGILAHEIGLLQYQDPRLSKVKKVLNQLIQVGAYIGPAFGSIGALSVLGFVVIGNMANREKSLEDRIQEADEKALGYMTKTGYDPQGLMDVLRRMLDPESPDRAYLYDYLQSHPISEERFKRLDQEFHQLPLENKNFRAGRNEFLTATETVRNNLVRK
ncbi:MAG: M48 family metalloprotease [Candidatus Omnitrophica bacterium]|nr:M48 family metalloprotease [Candidatus Omnitrophota bacterium]